MWPLAGYVLVAAIICIGLSWLAAWMTAGELRDQAALQQANVQANQPLWQWHTRKPRDLIAGRAFGHATLAIDDDALRVTSTDGTSFELGLPIAWSLDLAHWPILQLQLQSSARGTLSLLWQGEALASACHSSSASVLTPDTRTLRIDLRDLAWQSASGSVCPSPTVAEMFRLRIQIPANAAVRLTSATLLTTSPITPSSDTPIDLPNGDITTTMARAPMSPIPLFRLPRGIRAETMLAWRDRLRAQWPAALIVPAGGTPVGSPATSDVIAKWAACIVYLLALIGLVLHPAKGRLRPWLDIAGCLLGPLWLVMGLNWGLYPTLLGVLAFGGGLTYALIIERRHLPRLWRWPLHGRDWLWPLATVPFALALIVLHGHALHPLPWAHVFTYFGWALLQQWLMLVVLLRRFEQGMHRPALAVFAIAMVFALLHTPNGMLMQCCFVTELWWAWCFRRSRSVLPIGLAHAGCALLVESGLVGGWLRSLEVSARFFL